MRQFLKDSPRIKYTWIDMKKDDKLNINIYTEYLILDNFEKEPHTCILKELMNKQNDVYNFDE